MWVLSSMAKSVGICLVSKMRNELFHALVLISAEWGQFRFNKQMKAGWTLQASVSTWSQPEPVHYLYSNEINVVTQWQLKWPSHHTCCRCGWGFQEGDQGHPDPVWQDPAGCRSTSLRVQEVRWTWSPRPLPEVLPLIPLYIFIINWRNTILFCFLLHSCSCIWLSTTAVTCQ